MRKPDRNFTGRCSGYSLIELLISLALSLIILGGAVALYSASLQTRERESGRVDALTAAQAALSVMSREIGNAGYGLDDNNGLVLADCGAKQIRIRANVFNNDGVTSSAGEDIMYFYDSVSDRNANSGAGLTSGIINRVSDVDFEYHNYDDDGTSAPGSPATNTAKVTIKLSISLPDVPGQPAGREEEVTSDVTLRNAPYVLGRY
jgi:prepilin-type N-terminal cleavage/methylation domain-containing protein